MKTHEIFLEAEGFQNKGGWVIDQQSIPVIHSAYLMAHGMGEPVADATTGFEVPEAAEYSVWALTRDWTAPWQVKNPIGTYQIAVDGVRFSQVLGTNGADWAWQRAGRISLSSGRHTLSLCDLTGFNGRCDAVYLTTSEMPPSNLLSDIDSLRETLVYGKTETDPTHYGLVVVGGGISGLCTAIAASRGGVKTLLIQDRSVLGGCNSSDVRVCLAGRIREGEYEKLGDVVREIAPVQGHPAYYRKEYFEDDRKRLAAELAGVTLRLGTAVTDAEIKDGKILSVTALDIEKGKRTRITADLFADCSGDAVLARMAGCTMMYGKEGKSTYNEGLAPEENVRMTMGHSIRWYSEKTDHAVPFPDLDLGLAFNDTNYLNCISGDWEQESGFRRDMVYEIEYIRDYGLRAIFANWTYQKHHAANKERFANYKFTWISPIGGRREGYRVLGDYVLTQHDLDAETEYPDGTANITWGIDIHYPETLNEREFGEAFRSFAYHRGIPKLCPVPYRCLYARDAQNLFLGGRIISASHVAFSAVRVMRTLGMLGEVVGLAASLCQKHNCTPRTVYTEHLSELQSLMKAGVTIPDAFACGEINDVEKYHFKDIGWWNIDTGIWNPDWGKVSETLDPNALEKFKTCIKAIGIKHTHPMPKEWE